MKSNINNKHEDFSIICNNCLGGFIYQYYKTEYKTPTVGLFILAKDYIKFLKDLKFYLSKELAFIKPKESIHYEEFKEFEDALKFPIARLHDMEVFFMHYKSEEEAREKWNRRISRINWNNLIIIFAENETFNLDILKVFDSLPFKNKICFTKNEYRGIKSACCIKEMQEPGSLWSVEIVMKHFNINEFINYKE